MGSDFLYKKLLLLFFTLPLILDSILLAWVSGGVFSRRS
jgi:hypothetical protein